MGPFKGLHGNRELVAFQFDVEISRLASNVAADYFSPSLFTSGLEPIAHIDRRLDIGETQNGLVRHARPASVILLRLALECDICRNPDFTEKHFNINDRPWRFVK